MLIVDLKPQDDSYKKFVDTKGIKDKNRRTDNTMDKKKMDKITINLREHQSKMENPEKLATRRRKPNPKHNTTPYVLGNTKREQTHTSRK